MVSEPNLCDLYFLSSNCLFEDCSSPCNTTQETVSDFSDFNIISKLLPIIHFWQLIHQTVHKCSHDWFDSNGVRTKFVWFILLDQRPFVWRLVLHPNSVKNYSNVREYWLFLFHSTFLKLSSSKPFSTIMYENYIEMFSWLSGCKKCQYSSCEMYTFSCRHAESQPCLHKLV